MSFSVISPPDFVEKHSLQVLPAPTTGMLLIRNAIIDPEYCSAYHADTGDLIVESVVRKGPSLGINPRIKKQLDTHLLARLHSSSHQIVDRSILLPFPFQGCNHFGHLITEVVSFLYPIIADSSFLNRSIPIYLGWIPWRRSSIYHQVIQDSLCPTIIKPTSQPVLVRNLMIPLPTLYLRHSFSIFHRLALRTALPVLFRDLANFPIDGGWLPDVNMNKRIYLSRTRLGANQRKILNEEKLEDQLQGLGWEIIHPQLLPINQQLQKLAAARVVAGCLGSAFHLLQYLNPDNLAKKKILSIALEKSHFLNYALQYSVDTVDALCALALTRDQSNERQDINQDLLMESNSVSELLSWIHRHQA